MMRRKIMAIVLISVLITGLFSLQASAANESSMNMNVTYTKEIPTGYYEVGIPATLNVSENQTVYFTVNNVNLADNQELTISVDSGSTFDNHQFSITDGRGNRIYATLYREDRVTGDREELNNLNNPVVATFDEGDTMPTSWGNLFVMLDNTSRITAPPGTYNGYVHFNIAVVNK
jgi:hypothetical protein